MSWIRRLREAPVTVGLIALNLIVFAAMVVVSQRIVSFDGETLLRAGAMYSFPGQEAASHWRWLTAAFIHVGLLHVAMNLYVLGQIGLLSERALGRGLVAAGYVVTGVAGNMVSGGLAVLRDVPRVSAGASGAIMGLIGMAAAYAWLSGQRVVARSLAINVLFILGVGLSLSVGGVSLVDNAAHIGGLLAGIVLGVARVRMQRPLPRGVDVGLIVAAFVLAVIGFASVLTTVAAGLNEA
jgi:rhomboid protease GluP